jgi:hypothetical protein
VRWIKDVEKTKRKDSPHRSQAAAKLVDVRIRAVGRERRFPPNIHRMEKRFKAGIGVPALQLGYKHRAMEFLLRKQGFIH